MSPEDLAKLITGAIGGEYADGVLVDAHLDSDPTAIWVEVMSTETDGARGEEFRISIERQP